MSGAFRDPAVAGGQISMARIAAFGSLMLVAVLVIAAFKVAVQATEHSAGIIGALAALATPLMGGMWAALKERTTAADMAEGQGG